MKEMLITGASGFVGKYLARSFLEQGWRVTGLGTSPSHPFSAEFEAFDWISADTSRPGGWQDRVSRADIVVNLAGRNIFRYWTAEYKQSIYDSRIQTTRNVTDAMKGEGQTLLSTSAAGIYGDRGDTLLTEAQGPGSGFLSRVCVDWEKEAFRAAEKGARVAVMRLGVVLGEAGGALALMMPAFKMFAGGPLGGGDQWFPWIHIRDLVRAARFLLNDESLEGVFNFTGPTPIRQKEFAKALGRAISRPAFLPTPAFAVRLVMGELGKALLESQKAVPRNLIAAGFGFEFPEAEAAIADVAGK